MPPELEQAQMGEAAGLEEDLVMTAELECVLVENAELQRALEVAEPEYVVTAGLWWKPELVWILVTVPLWIVVVWTVACVLVWLALQVEREIFVERRSE